MKLPDETIDDLADIVEEACKLSVQGIMAEVAPRDIGTLEVEKADKTTFLITSNSPVWTWLNDGTGLYGPKHEKIVPVLGKALHFKSVQIAAALGFKDENVFLASVKGIRPRYFFERYFEMSQFDRNIAEVLAQG